MNKAEFKELCKNKLLFLDGATGSNLVKAGMPAGVCPELWILEHPEVMIRLQKEYVEAGTNILYAPTFTGNRIKLAEYGLEGKQEEMLRNLVALSKEAAGDKAFVAGDLTMTGKQLKPIGPLDFEDLITIYKEQIEIMVSAGVDLLVVETMMSLQETRAALIAAKEVCELPVLCTLTFEKDGRTLYGTDATTAMITLQSLGADAVGANCSSGPDLMAEIVAQMYEVAQIPVIAKPNAGMPFLAEDGSTGYSMGADEFAVEICKVVESGASIIGGCCGTSPEYIAKCVKTLSYEMLPAQKELPKRMFYLTSERKTVAFHVDSPFMVIGERINPTGKKKLQAELKEGSLQMVSSFASDQEEMGASILDVNMGMPGIDEKAMMLRALDEVTMASNLPISIDSSHVDVIEAALRRYPGRALINSISLEEIKCEPLLRLASKYGAMFILLPLSDEGLPKDCKGKMQNVEKLAKKAEEYGLSSKDFIVDGLVMTVGANSDAALSTLETFRECHRLGLATTCGLSNISFGLPDRINVNSAFLTMAVQNGLTMAIANPSQRQLMLSAYSSDLLMDKEGASEKYIDYVNYVKEMEEAEAQQKALLPSTDKIPTKTPITVSQESGRIEKVPESMRTIFRAVLKGKREEAADQTKAAIEAGEAAPDVLNLSLLPAMDEVGDLFDKGKYFLPQLINSAEAMKNAIAVLEPLLMQDNDSSEQKKVVIATVKGDIHDIGKNLVALMLKNHGFEVIDLGKDVESELIVDTAIKEKADIIALSALMTTTMLQMKEVVNLVKERGVDSKVIIGGAVITQDFADEIGADGYSKDAADAVVLVKRLLEMA